MAPRLSSETPQLITRIVLAQHRIGPPPQPGQLCIEGLPVQADPARGRGTARRSGVQGAGDCPGEFLETGREIQLASEPGAVKAVVDPCNLVAQSGDLGGVAQGRTVDTTHLLVTGPLSRQALYVGMTRGRESNTAHVVTGKTAPAGKKPYQQAAPESVLASVMQREAGDLLRPRRSVRTSCRPRSPCRRR